MQIIGLILARGGSQRVPHKNIKHLANKPLLAYTIEEIKKSAYVNRLIVSTDDEQIAEVAQSYGCEAPFRRPKEIAGPDSTELQAVTHALEWLRSNELYTPDLIVLLRPTSPFRKVKTVDRAIEMLLEDNRADSVRSVRLCSEHPHKMWVLNDQRIRSLIPVDQKLSEAHTLSYHLLPTVYIQNASFDVLRAQNVFTKKSTTGTEIIPIVMNEWESLDINTPLDFQFAEWAIQNQELLTSSGILSTES